MPSRHREDHWPKRWTRKNGAIYFVVPKEVRHLWEDRSWFRLGATEMEAWREWFARTKPPEGVPRTISEAILRYRGEILHTKGERTQKDYDRYLTMIDAGFGHMAPRELRPAQIYQAMDRMKPVAANRMRSTLSTLMSYCVRWGAIDRNPVREVHRNSEQPRDLYVEDEQLEAFLRHAGPLVRAWVPLKQATGLRQGQMLALDEDDWNDATGELTARGVKKGFDVVYYGGQLRAAVEGVFALQRRPSRGEGPQPLFRARNGDRYTDDGFRSLWQYAMTKHVEGGGERFTEHDIRAKVASDSEDDLQAQARMGHRSLNTTRRVYRRKPQRVSAA